MNAKKRSLEATWQHFTKANVCGNDRVSTVRCHRSSAQRVLFHVSLYFVPGILVPRLRRSTLPSMQKLNFMAEKKRE